MRMLGKRAPRFDSRTLRLTRYTEALPAPPPQASWQARVSRWGMMLNDTLGDCVCAAAGHMIEQWTTYAGAQVVPADSAILKAYELIGGYNPSDPSTDQGCDMLTALKTWRTSGIAAHKISAFMAIDGGVLSFDSDTLFRGVKRSVSLFGNCYLGLDLPLSAQSQPGGWFIDDKDPNASVPGSWGGHCVPVVAYDEQGLTVVTWGQLMPMSWHFLARYCDEAYAVLSQDWLSKEGKSGGGVDWTTLQKDLAIVTA